MNRHGSSEQCISLTPGGHWHVSVTSFPPGSMNLALQSPQMLFTHFALGWAGHLITSHGAGEQFTAGLLEGHST